MSRAYTTAAGYKLGHWINKQRAAKRAGVLDPDRADRLERVHPTWTWDPRGSAWEEGYENLRNFVAANGDALVPQGYKTEADYGLGAWVSHQRSLKRKGNLSAERVALLEIVHPTWVWDPHDALWEEGCRFLLQFAAENENAHG